MICTVFGNALTNFSIYFIILRHIEQVILKLTTFRTVTTGTILAMLPLICSILGI